MSEMCKTKPIEIGHKSTALKELTSDVFALTYAKQTQFRAVTGFWNGDWGFWIKPEAGTQTSFSIGK